MACNLPQADHHYTAAVQLLDNLLHLIVLSDVFANKLAHRSGCAPNYNLIRPHWRHAAMIPLKESLKRARDNHPMLWSHDQVARSGEKFNARQEEERRTQKRSKRSMTPVSKRSKRLAIKVV